MPLSEQQTRLAHTRDTPVRQVLAHSRSDEALLISMADSRRDLHAVVGDLHRRAMDTFCDQYDGSPRLATLLERLTESLAKGSSAVLA